MLAMRLSPRPTPLAALRQGGGHRAWPSLWPSAPRLALALALGTTALVPVHALDLARPVVTSRQGEPLQAEIDITRLSAQENQTLSAELARPEDYRSAQLDYPQELDLRIELARRDNGRPFLRIRSTQAVTASTLDLLLSLRWAGGQSMRDLKLALDNANAPPPGPSAPLGEGAARVTVQPGDTASAIVGRSPVARDVSLDQMLLALLRNNPQAFVENNVNRLRAGSVLALPSSEQAKAIPREEAREEMLFQTQDFQAYRANLAGIAADGELASSDRVAQGRLQAQVQNRQASTAQDKLTLTAPTQGSPEATLAQQRQARDVAQRAAEIGRNVTELGKLAAEVAAATGDGVNLPQPAPTHAAWLDDLAQHPLTPVGAGALVAAMVLLALWRRQRRRDRAQGAELPALKVDFDLELPDLPPLPATAAERTAADAPTPSTASAPAAGAPQSAPAPARARVPLGIPDISLELGDDSPHALEVRLQLAKELWDLGQLHTSRALMEEVAAQAQGDLQTQARQWLKDRS